VTGLAAIARELRGAEGQESQLLARRGAIPAWRRAARRDLTTDLDETTTHVDALHDELDVGAQRLRDDLVAAQYWWRQNRSAVVDTIAARRERYRRGREPIGSAPHQSSGRELSPPTLGSMTPRRADHDQRNGLNAAPSAEHAAPPTGQSSSHPAWATIASRRLRWAVAVRSLTSAADARARVCSTDRRVPERLGMCGRAGIVIVG